MESKRAKNFLLVFLLIVFLLQAGTVFALEVRWPSVPGTETPNIIQDKISMGIISKDTAFPYYVNYFLRLFYIIAIAVAAIVIIYGGILYLFSGVKPAIAKEAKERISQGLLGLLILLTSYLVLAVINPQLLVYSMSLSKRKSV